MQPTGNGSSNKGGAALLEQSDGTLCRCAQGVQLGCFCRDMCYDELSCSSTEVDELSDARIPIHIQVFPGIAARDRVETPRRAIEWVRIEDTRGLTRPTSRYTDKLNAIDRGPNRPPAKRTAWPRIWSKLFVRLNDQSPARRCTSGARPCGMPDSMNRSPSLLHPIVTTELRREAEQPSSISCIVMLGGVPCRLRSGLRPMSHVESRRARGCRIHGGARVESRPRVMMRPPSATA